MARCRSSLSAAAGATSVVKVAGTGASDAASAVSGRCCHPADRLPGHGARRVGLQAHESLARRLRDHHVAASRGTAVGSLGTRPSTMALKQEPEVKCGGRRAALIRAPVGGRGPGQITRVLEPTAKDASGCGAAALVGAPIGRLGGHQVAPALEQDAEVERGDGIAATIGGLKRSFGAVQVTLPFEPAAAVHGHAGLALLNGLAVGLL
jgi:hypothetical protein